MMTDDFGDEPVADYDHDYRERLARAQFDADHPLDADVTRGIYEVDLIHGDIIYQSHKVTVTGSGDDTGH